MAKIKGAAVVGAVRFLRHHADRARRILPPALHPYLQERVNVAAWYPEGEFLELLRACAEIMGGARAEIYQEAGRLTARDHAAGVYAHLLQGSEPALMVARSMALWKSQHDTGEMVVTRVGPREQRIELRDYGMPSREMCAVVAGYIQETFALTGAPDAEVEHVECRMDGDPVCAWRCRWGEASARSRTP